MILMKKIIIFVLMIFKSKFSLCFYNISMQVYIGGDLVGKLSRRNIMCM